MKEFKTFGLSCLSTKKTVSQASGICNLYQVVTKKKKVRCKLVGIDQKCHPCGLPETDILLSMVASVSDLLPGGTGWSLPAVPTLHRCGAWSPEVSPYTLWMCQDVKWRGQL